MLKIPPESLSLGCAQSMSTADDSETRRLDSRLITRRRARARRRTAGGTYDLPRCRKSRLARNFDSHRLTAISKGKGRGGREAVENGPQLLTPSEIRVSVLGAQPPSEPNYRFPPLPTSPPPPVLRRLYPRASFATNKRSAGTYGTSRSDSARSGWELLGAD